MIIRMRPLRLGVPLAGIRGAVTCLLCFLPFSGTSEVSTTVLTCDR